MALSHKEYIVALGKLMNYASNKRFGISNNTLGANEKLSLQLNDEIKNETGIDIFSENSYGNIVLYENKIYNEIIKYTEKNIPVSIFDADILNFKKDAVQLEKDYFVNNNFLLDEDMDNTMAECRKKIGLTFPSSNTYFKTSEYAMIYPLKYKDEKVNFYFLTTKARIHNQERILFFLLANFDINDSVIMDHRSRRNALRKINKNILTTRLIFSLNYNKYSYLISNPINVFLKIVDIYGVPIEFNNKNKKLFVSEFSPSLKPIDFINLVDSRYADSGYIGYITKETKFGILYFFIFILDLVRYYKDLESHKI